MLNKIKQLRDQTGAGVVDVKRALDEAAGDEKKALELLRKRGQDKANKKSDREAKEGVISVYIHSNNKIGAMVKVLCETDFVARNTEFKDLAHDIAMHVAASCPIALLPQDINDDLIKQERKIWVAQLKAEKKPVEIMEKIMAGKEKKFREERALLTQLFVKNPDITINDLIIEKIGKIGENIQIGDFVRYEL